MHVCACADTAVLLGPCGNHSCQMGRVPERESSGLTAVNRLLFTREQVGSVVLLSPKSKKETDPTQCEGGSLWEQLTHGGQLGGLPEKPWFKAVKGRSTVDKEEGSPRRKHGVPNSAAL